MSEARKSIEEGLKLKTQEINMLKKSSEAEKLELKRQIELKTNDMNQVVDKLNISIEKNSLIQSALADLEAKNSLLESEKSDMITKVNELQEDHNSSIQTMQSNLQETSSKLESLERSYETSVQRGILLEKAANFDVCLFLIKGQLAD